MPSRLYRPVLHWLRPVDVLLFAAVGLLAYLVWTAVFHPPSPPFRYTAPFAVHTPRVRAGDTLELVVSRCNDSPAEISYTLSRAVQDAESGERYPLPVVAGTIAPGCGTTISRAHVVPPNVPPGRYFLSVVASVSDGGHAWAVPGRSDDFEVVGNGGG